VFFAEVAGSFLLRRFFKQSIILKSRRISAGRGILRSSRASLDRTAGGGCRYAVKGSAPNASLAFVRLPN
jgi:hypothetical protein